MMKQYMQKKNDIHELIKLLLEKKSKSAIDWFKNNDMIQTRRNRGAGGAAAPPDFCQLLFLMN